MSVFYNDINTYCCQTLCENIEAGHLLEGTVSEQDIRHLSTNELLGYQHIHLFAGIGGIPYGLYRAGVTLSTRIITGGFPCQDLSLAGERAGLAGERSGLWGEMYRIIEEITDCGVGPDYIIVENVRGLLIPTRRDDGSIEAAAALSRVLGDMAASGYDAIWRVFSSAEFGAPHLRERVYIIAYPNRVGLSRRKISRSSQEGRTQTHQQSQGLLPSDFRVEISKGVLCHMDDGISQRMVKKRVARGGTRAAIEALGNSVDPRISEFLGKCIVASRQ